MYSFLKLRIMRVARTLRQNKMETHISLKIFLFQVSSFGHLWLYFQICCNSQISMVLPIL